MTHTALILAAAAAMLAADHDPLAGRVAGPPQQCLTVSTLFDGPSIVDPHTILYRSGSKVFRTGPRDACPSLRPFTTLIVEVHGGQLCRGDLFRVLENGSSIPSAACQFTEFTPYTKVK